jgi:hypothetical protein
MVCRIEEKMAEKLVMENAKLVFRNFEGREMQFNPAGRRNFCVELDVELAKQLTTDGWNIRWPDPDDLADGRLPLLQIAVNYNKRPPTIVSMTATNKVVLNERTIKDLDIAEIESADVIVVPYAWEVGGKTGIKAYVKSLYVKIVEDELAEKYRDIPDRVYDDGSIPF